MATLRERYDAVMAMEKGLDWHREHYAPLRAEIRKVLHWPYAYTKPVEWGGYCTDCEGRDGRHYNNCAAVN